MKKKMFTLWMTGLFLLLTTLGVAAQNSGTTGPLNWNYDTGTKTLTITETGAIPDFAYADAQPWKDVRNEIEKVKIEAGVTSVGDNAFHACEKLTSITLPAGLEKGSEMAPLGNAGRWPASRCPRGSKRSNGTPLGNALR